jgi:Na+/melibiose symporter-like transporter
MTGGFVLSAIQFPTNVDATGVSADVVFRMGVFMGPILGTLYLVPILVYTFYHLDRTRHAAIQNELHAMREARIASESAPFQAAAGGQ